MYGGVSIFAEHAILRNNTIAYNKGLGGILVYRLNESHFGFSNNILWKNYDLDGNITNTYLYGNKKYSFESNIINDGSEGLLAGSSVQYGEGDLYYSYYADGITPRNNSECAPRFVDVPVTAAGNYPLGTVFDFSVKSNSPAIDAGVSTSFSNDFDFALKPNSPAIGTGLNGVDIGAFEFAGTPTTVAPCLGAEEVSGLNNDASCLGNDGSIDLSVFGAIGNLTYVWSNGSTTEDLADLSAGIYSVEVVDKGTGCEASGAVEVSDASPVFGAIELSPCPPKGTLNFIVRSGVGPFVAKVSKSHHITGASEGYIRLDWEKHEEVSFAGGVEVSLLLDTKGHYNLEIYDANDELVLVYEFSVTTSTWNKDCTAAERGRGEGNKRVGSFEEEMSIESEGVENVVFGMYPNPASRDLTVSLSEELEEVTIEIYNTIGSRVLVETMTSQRSQLDVSDLVNGMYFVRLRSNNKLIKQQSFVVAH